ncbi:unnamed protein product [Leuciscus chuanchicus]
MAPFSLMSIGANVLVKSLSLFSSASVVRCSCVAPVIRSFSTTTGGPPKRPLTGYMTYVKEMQPNFSRQNPGLKNVDIIRKLAEKWRMLTPEQKQELNSLGKPKRPRSAFNIFMAEHFEEAKGTTMQTKLKSLRDDWMRFNITQKQMYTQLAEDDKVRYKNEIKSWEDHMIEIGREDLVRRKERRSIKSKANADKKKKSKVTVIKAKAPKKKAEVAGTAVKKTVKSTKK